MPEITFSNIDRVILLKNKIMIQFNDERVWKDGDDMNGEGYIYFHTKFSSTIFPFISVSTMHNDYTMIKTRFYTYSIFCVNIAEFNLHTEIHITEDGKETKTTDYINFGNDSIIEKDIEISWLAIGAK